MKRVNVIAAPFVAACAISGGAAHAIDITPTNDAFGLANTLFLNTPGVSLQSAFLTSAAQENDSGGFQAGTYQNPQGTYGLPNSGIVLSSGDVSDYATGPNNENGRTTGFDDMASSATQSQITRLQNITGQDDPWDPVELSINFFANDITESVTFFAAFGSEEFPEFVGGSFTDGFGLFVNDTNVAGVVPTGGTPADILPVNIDHPDFAAIPGTELNGVLAPNDNPVLRFDVPVNPGEVNTFDILLADLGDASFDTTVYLSSFFSEDSGGGTDGGGTGGGGTGGGGNDGSSEFTPLLPSNPPDPDTGAFIIEIPDTLPDGELIWVDPPVTVGYTYESDGAAFAGLQAPSLATLADLDGYLITVDGMTVVLLPGASLDFLTEFGVNPTEFTLSGIDPALMLDPTDPMAFPLAVSFLPFTFGPSLTITPVTDGNGITPTAPIPLPAGGILLSTAIIGGLSLRAARRRHG